VGYRDFTFLKKVVNVNRPYAEHRIMQRKSFRRPTKKAFQSDPLGIIPARVLWSTRNPGSTETYSNGFIPDTCAEETRRGALKEQDL
jgi:hypothetical protein